MAVDGSNIFSPDYRDTYETLLMGYAFGVLDQAQSLIVAGHLTLSPKARHFARMCEDMAGNLLEKDCTPVAMSDHALSRIMTAIDSTPCSDKSACCGGKNKHLPEELNLPEPLETPLRNCTNFHWKTLGGGFKSYELSLGCRSSKAQFMKVEPGIKTPEHKHEGLEITLILGGAVMDGSSLYRRGDLIVADETITHGGQSCPQAGCVCMVVTTSTPVSKLTGLMGLLNPFLKS